MLPFLIFLVLTLILVWRPVLGFALIAIGIVLWFASLILAIFWPVIASIIVAGIYLSYKFKKALTKDHISLQRKD